MKDFVWVDWEKTRATKETKDALLTFAIALVNAGAMDPLVLKLSRYDFRRMLWPQRFAWNNYIETDSHRISREELEATATRFAGPIGWIVIQVKEDEP